MFILLCIFILSELLIDLHRIIWVQSEVFEKKISVRFC
jgi:hypothetical protein